MGANLPLIYPMADKVAGLYITHKEIPLSIHAFRGIVVGKGVFQPNRVVEVDRLLNVGLGVSRGIRLARPVLVPAGPEGQPIVDHYPRVLGLRRAGGRVQEGVIKPGALGFRGGGDRHAGGKAVRPDGL